MCFPGLSLFGILVLLLLIFLQAFLLHFAGVFIHSDKVLIGPVLLCQISQHDESVCIPRERGFPPDLSGHKMYISGVMLPVCFYVPIVLVPFAGLSLLLAAYGKDRTTLRCSLACQVASSLFTLGGIITFLLCFHSYLSWNNVTLWFYLCLGVAGQLIFTTLLTNFVVGKLTSDWK